MSIIGDIFGAFSADRGQRRAAQVAQDTSAASIAEQRRQYDQSRADMQPWLTTGGGALSQLARLYGINQPSAQTQPVQGSQVPQASFSYSGSGVQSPMSMPAIVDVPLIDGGNWGGPTTPSVGGGGNVPVTGGGGGGLPVGGGGTTQQPATGGGQYDTFWQSPDYQFRLNESMRALTARNAALGIQDSGAAQRAALTLAGNQASGEYNNYANRLAALAGVGQTAAQNNATLGSNFANAITNINSNTAQALGSSYTNRGNIWGNLINNWSGQAARAGSALFGGF